MTTETFRYQPKTHYRDLYENLAMWESLMKECPTDNAEILEKRNDHLVHLKREIRFARNRMSNNRYAVSARFPYRHRFINDNDDGSVSEYWYEPDEGETDEELNEYIDSMTMEVHSPYDCSGQRFTWDINWKRTPYGIRFIHRTALDI